MLNQFNQLREKAPACAAEQNANAPLILSEGKALKTDFKSEILTERQLCMTVPTEAYLRKKLSLFHEHIKQQYGLNLVPYRGVGEKEAEQRLQAKKRAEQETLKNAIKNWLIYDTASLEQELLALSALEDPAAIIFDRILELPIFEYLYIESMNSGHYKNQKGCVTRRYTLESRYCQPIACIHFKIHPLKKVCTIKALGVAERYQCQGLGSVLLQLAIFVAILYGCDYIRLSSSAEGFPCYLKHGFNFVINADDQKEKLRFWETQRDNITPEIINEMLDYKDANMKLDLCGEDLKKFFQRFSKFSPSHINLLAEVAYHQKTINSLNKRGEFSFKVLSGKIATNSYIEKKAAESLEKLQKQAKVVFSSSKLPRHLNFR